MSACSRAEGTEFDDVLHAEYVTEDKIAERFEALKHAVLQGESIFAEKAAEVHHTSNDVKTEYHDDRDLRDRPNFTISVSAKHSYMWFGVIVEFTNVEEQFSNLFENI